MQPLSRNSIFYILFVAIETALASFLFWIIFPIFRNLIANMGKEQDLQPWIGVIIVGDTFALLCFYWARYRFFPIYTPFHSAVVGHLLQFTSRASFFIGGALFSVIFFRHVPELDPLPPIGQILVKGFIVMSVLFALFCYSLELERLGKAIEVPPEA
ncbi:hypothetical protein AB4037_30015 [Labrys sp. KB_33_2]|uniref:hypothetical protein n=1 Tax=Labrys sp. KB_33_2 TaxID=3237479 RepID=UPI003F938C67